jgi:uncharacterized membrane protein YkvA (DUF1232 family)
MIKRYLPWLIALIYFISPYDVIPDFFLGLGWLDDLAVLGLVYWWVSRLKKASRDSAGTSSTGGGSGPGFRPGYREAEEDPYSILGLEPGATKDEIRAAYKKKASQYHPDKVQHLGEDFQELAHEKFVAIQKAYDKVKG